MVKPTSYVMEKIKKTKCVIVVHEGVPVGPAYDLKRYLFSRNVEELLFIAHPLTYIPEFYKARSRYEEYCDGKLVAHKSAFLWLMPDVLLYMKDIAYTVFWLFSTNKTYDIFFGVDCLNALSGIILRRLGRTKKVVYYTIDYFTERFNNPIVNRVYHAVDKFCVKYADETWNLSAQMAIARKNYNGMTGKEYKKQKVVPIGVWYDQVKRKPYEKINKKKLVFIGSFTPMMGIDCIVDAAPLLRKKVPGLRIELIGNGPEFSRLKRKIKKLGVGDTVRLHGWISDRKKLAGLLSDAAVGLAPFNTNLVSDEIKNADPAKIKDYMVWGVPVIVTDAISNLRTLVNEKCAVAISYDPVELADAVIFLIKDDKRLKEYRENASSYVRQFDYEALYSINVTRLLQKN